MAPDGLPPMPFGISSWTYAWSIGVNGAPTAPKRPMSALGLLEKAVEAGVHLVQIADNLPLDRLSQDGLSEVRSFAGAHQLRLEVGTRGVEPALLLRNLEIAAYLGSPFVRTLTAPPGQKPALGYVEASLRAVLPHFEKAGISIALENYEAHRVCELAGLLRAIEHPCLGICLDTVNSLGALEGPEQVVPALAPYVLNVHLKDVGVVRAKSLMGFAIEGRPAGQGCLDIDWLFRQLSAAHRRPTVILELWTPLQTTTEETILLEQSWAEASIRYLKTLSWLTSE
jgi:sugar phosphate isomerase/epimerase